MVPGFVNLVGKVDGLALTFGELASYPAELVEALQTYIDREDGVDGQGMTKAILGKLKTPLFPVLCVGEEKVSVGRYGTRISDIGAMMAESDPGDYYVVELVAPGRKPTYRMFVSMADDCMDTVYESKEDAPSEDEIYRLVADNVISNCAFYIEQIVRDRLADRVIRIAIDELGCGGKSEVDVERAVLERAVQSLEADCCQALKGWHAETLMQAKTAALRRLEG